MLSPAHATCWHRRPLEAGFSTDRSWVIAVVSPGAYIQRMDSQRTLHIPMSLQEARTRGLRPSQLTPVFLKGHKLRGTFTSDAHVRTVRIPLWAHEDPHWWTLFTELNAVTATRPHAMVTGNSAAYLRGLPVKLRPELDIAVPNEHGPIAVPHVRTFRMTDTTNVTKEGLRFHHLGGILHVIARQEPVENLVAVLDALMGTWRRPAELTRTKLDQLVAAGPKVHGWSKLKQASALARENVASPQETRLRLALVRAGLPEPVVAYPVWIERFGTHIHPDLAYPFAKIAIEYEGRHHFELTEQVLKDTDRYYELGRLGWTVIRVTALHEMHSIVLKVRECLGV